MNELHAPARRVLCVGDDPTLLAVRELLLTRFGYSVCSVPDWAMTERMILSGFDVLLVCHSVPPSRAEEISGMVRSRDHDLTTVRLAHCESGEAAGFDATWNLDMGPAQFLQQLATLFEAKGRQPEEATATLARRGPESCGGRSLPLLVSTSTIRSGSRPGLSIR